MLDVLAFLICFFFFFFTLLRLLLTCILPRDYKKPKRLVCFDTPVIRGK